MTAGTAPIGMPLPYRHRACPGGSTASALLTPERLIGLQEETAQNTLADEHARKREELLTATEKKLDIIVLAT